MMEIDYYQVLLVIVEIHHWHTAVLGEGGLKTDRGGLFGGCLDLFAEDLSSLDVFGSTSINLYSEAQQSTSAAQQSTSAAMYLDLRAIIIGGLGF